VPGGVAELGLVLHSSTVASTRVDCAINAAVPGNTTRMAGSNFCLSIDPSIAIDYRALFGFLMFAE
jgi:hypothetical protein